VPSATTSRRRFKSRTRNREQTRDRLVSGQFAEAAWPKCSLKAAAGIITSELYSDNSRRKLCARFEDCNCLAPPGAHRGSLNDFCGSKFGREIFRCTIRESRERQLRACLESMKDVKGGQRNAANLNLVYVSILVSLNTALIAILV